jgi:hemerythrin
MPSSFDNPLPRRDPMEWSDELLTGMAEMDQQHRILVGILGEARRKLHGSEGRAVFDRLSRDLLAYALFHFESEERLMQERGYFAAEPEAAAQHLEQHRDFSRRVTDLRAAAGGRWPDAGDELLQFLEDWLVHHIKVIDRRLAKHLAAGPH